MAIFVKTKTPNALIKKIKEAIDNNAIDTWSYDQQGDFTHETEQWARRAWIRALPENGRVVFYVLCRRDKSMSVTEYAVYHGRFVEMLLAHFDKECEDITVSPLATSYDCINADNK